MDFWDILALSITTILLLYLFFALSFPEKLS